MKRLFSARALPAIVLSVAMCVRAQTPTNDAAAAAEPSWWSGIWAAGRVNADNDAPINVGQLKHVASRALAWLETLPETPSITEAEEPAAYAALGVFRRMVAGWTPGPAADNAAPVPVGALKETAAKFHDVLAALGYPLVTGETVGDVMETEEGLTNPPRYPWGAAGTLEELQAPANVGQLKTAFRAPHPGLVKGSVDLHPRLTLADDGLAVAGPETLAAQTLPVWGAPRMGAVAYAANGSSLVPNVPTLPSAVRLARPTELRFSPWLDPVWFQGVVHFTAVEHRIGEVTTWIPVVSSGVLAENVLLPYSPGLSADFKRGTYVEFAQVATVRDRPAAGGSAAITIRSAYPLVRRGTLAADSRLRYSVTVEGECTFAGGSEVRFHQFPRLIERAWLDRAVSIEQFEAVGMVAQGTLSATMAAQPVQASPGVTLNLAPGTVADFAGFLTRHLVASGSPPPADVPTDLMTSGSGTDLPEHAGALPDNAGPNPYVTLTESAGARVFFRALLEPRPGDLRPVTRIYQDTNSSYWYRESEQAVGWLARGITAAEVDLPAGVLGVGKVKCAAQHPVTFRHFLHEVTAPPPGTPVDEHTIDEYIHGYLASAVTGGLATVSMPAKRVREAGEPAGAGPELVMIPVPPLHRVAFEYDAMSLSIGSAPWWLPVVRGLLIPGSVSPVASNPQAADADGDGFTAGEEMRMGSSDGDAAVPGGVRPFLASALAGLGPHVIHDERDAPRPVGNGAWGHQTVVSIPVTAEATKRYLSLVVTHRGFPRGTRSAVGDTLTWSLTGAGAALGGTVKASDLHHVWLNSMAGGRTLGGARPFWVIPLGFVVDGEAAAGVTVTTASARGEWVVAAVLTEDSQALAGVGGRFVAAGAGVPENYVRINDRPAAIPFARRPQISGDSTPSGSAAGFDSDGDFSPDLEEQAAGTDPEDKYSAPVVLSSLVLNRETFRYVPNPHGWSGYTDLNVNDGWAVVDHSTPNSFGVSGLGRTYVTFPVPGTQYRTNDFHGTEYRGELDGHAKDFGSIWKELEPPAVSRGLPADNGGNDGVDAAWSLYVPEPERRYSAPVPYRSEYLATTGKRYRLRGPLSDADQSRTFLRVCWEKTWPSYEAYMRDVRNFGYGWEEMTGPKTAALGDPVSVTMKTLTIPKGAQYSDEEVDLVPKLAMDPARDGMPRVVVERLLPVEIEIKHTEKERDDEGNELTTTINPGATTLLRDEIADLRVKVPTVGNTDWDMKLELEPADMKTQTLGSRGAVQMYDFGTIDPFGTITPLSASANGTTKAGPYDIRLLAGNSGDETFRIVVNKEGKFKLRLKSADNEIDVLSQEFTVTKRIRKYARRPENNNADFDRHDKAFIDAAEAWGTFYNNPLDPDILKAMGMQESTLGYGTTPTADILTINYGGNDQDHVLAILHKEHTTNEKEAIPGGDNGWTIRWLDYDDAAAGSARAAIHWGTCWLFHKAQKGRFVSATNSPPHYSTFGGWNTWETAVGYYGPNPVYLGVIEGPWKRGRRDSTTGKIGGVWKRVDFAEGNFEYIWPILSNKRPRK